MIIITIVIFIFILGILVFIHELGHFLAARRSGMKVHEFGFGFPPKIFGIKKGETVYSVNLIPLGGFVKIAGEEGVSNDPRSFANASFWNRLLTLLAGVLMNFVLGWMLLFLGFFLIGSPVDSETAQEIGNAYIREEYIRVTAVLPKSSAEFAGFKIGDIVASVDNQKFKNVDEIIAYNKANLGKKVTFELIRGKNAIFRDVTPDPNNTQAPVGFGLEKIAKVTFPIYKSLKLATLSFLQVAFIIFAAIGGLIQKLFSTGNLTEGLSGPIGIAAMTKDFINSGVIYVVHFIAILSINLGVLNSFPFPALDGGRVMFLFIEKIRGSKSVQAERVANILGFLLLMALMIIITFKDIGRFTDEFKRLFERMI